MSAFNGGPMSASPAKPPIIVSPVQPASRSLDSAPRVATSLPNRIAVAFKVSAIALSGKFAAVFPPLSKSSSLRSFNNHEFFWPLEARFGSEGPSSKHVSRYAKNLVKRLYIGSPSAWLPSRRGVRQWMNSWASLPDFEWPARLSSSSGMLCSSDFSYLDSAI